MHEKLWLNEAMDKYNKKFKKGHLNIINSPAGSGKTSFIFKHFIEKHKQYGVEKLRLNKIIYLCDTSNMVRKICKNNSCREYDSKTMDLRIIKSDNALGTMNKITVMTYAMLGNLLRYTDNKEAIFNSDIIIFDEVHQIISYSYKFDSENDKIYENVLDIISRLKNKCFCIGLSATVDEYIEYRLNAKNCDCNLIFNYEELQTIKRYNFEPKYTNNTFNIVKEYSFRDIFNKNEKLLIYTPKIQTAIMYKEYLNKAGIKCEWICSPNAYMINQNEEKIPRMNDYQENIRQELVDKGELADESIQCLIINAACETSIDFNDEKCEFQHVIINDINMRTQIQSRNRLRHDIKELYVLAKYAYDGELIRRITYEGKYRNIEKFHEVLYKTNLSKYIDDKYINKKLTKDMKRELTYKYGVINYNNKRLTFKSLQKDIEESGIFKVYKNNNGIWIFRIEELKKYLYETNKKYSDFSLYDYFKYKKNKKEICFTEFMNKRLSKEDINNLAKFIKSKKDGKLRTSIKSINDILKEYKYKLTDYTDWKRINDDGTKNINYGKKYYQLEII